MRLKHTLSILTVGIAAFIGSTEVFAEKSYINLLFNDGKTVNIELTDGFSLNVDGSVINVSNSDTSYQISDLHSISYTRSLPTGLDSAPVTCSIIFEADGLVITSTAGDNVCRITRIDGMTVAALPFDTRLEIPNSDLPEGVCIISINDSQQIKRLIRH